MKKTIDDISVEGRQVLVRVDFNVPMNADQTIADDTRIRACLPTIQNLTGRGARVILCSHLGRPKGRVVHDLSLAPAGKQLSVLLDQDVHQAPDCIGPAVQDMVSRMTDGDVLLLENLRFHPEEEANDPVFSSQLALLAEIYVNDAFGASHRNHASVVGITRFLPAVAGLLMQKELIMLGGLLENPTRPFAAIVGGAKVSSKIGVLENILNKTDLLIIGGGMAATFLAAKGYPVGTTPVERDRLSYIAELSRKATSKNVRILLPKDLLVSEKADGTGKYRSVTIDSIQENEAIVDIGAATIAQYTAELKECRTIVWNGPMGIFEVPAFSEGTRAIASTLASLDAVTVVGGGSTAEIVTEMGLSNRMSHVSTGGGASLQFLAGEPLPGVNALPDR